MDKIKEIVEWLNNEYNQDSEKYIRFDDPKSSVIMYDKHTVISFWACGAIICMGSILYFVSEDDGFWYEKGCPCFSIGWAESYINALSRLKEYVWENGTPVNYSGTNIVCHYEL